MQSLTKLKKAKLSQQKNSKIAKVIPNNSHEVENSENQEIITKPQDQDVVKTNNNSKNETGFKVKIIMSN